ncbi:MULTISPECIES: DUF1688 family protein [unclassified Pseudoalteromonas]|uniref:DUF1688 family protein n=1 Tax=unclassified Pseudoalteromonas TaxID=194690 RepID=UPI0005A779F6|nr:MULTISPECIES: DUF1688 family protein [unclassified Pseudoalteromonas]
MIFTDINDNDVSYLLSPKEIRERSQEIYELSLAGKGAFKINISRLDEVADYVLAVIKDNYPSLNIPFHSRWSHFQVGNIDRLQILDEKLNHLSLYDKARAKLDLVLVFVLLDAGAGSKWRYFDKNSGQSFSRSEGLAIASFDMFMAGAFSSDKSHPLQVDAASLMSFNQQKLEVGFQVSDNNPLEGLDGRTNLICELGNILNNNDAFTHNRPGNILDFLTHNYGEKLKAEAILESVLINFGDIWPGRICINNINMGDLWAYSKLKSDDPLSCLVPFHKLSQWLTYSLIEPILEAGITVTGIEKLTGLAEYRNGGLLLDKQLIVLKDESNLLKPHLANSDLIIEWRALTIVLLDKIADSIRDKLNMSDTQLPLAKVLEGGTWWAGRKVAQTLRNTGEPPLKLDSDGTVF